MVMLLVNYNEIESLKRVIIEGLKDVSIKDTKKWLSLASDLLAMLNYSIKINRLDKDAIGRDLEEQINRKMKLLELD